MADNKPAMSTGSGNTTEVTPLSTTANVSPLKSLSPRFPISVMRKKSSQKSSVSNLPVREINDFDMFDMPSHIDIHSLLKDFILPRLPQHFRVCLDVAQMRRKRKLQKQPKVLFLARPKNVSLTPGAAPPPPQSSYSPESMENKARPIAATEIETEAVVSPNNKDLQKCHKTRITEDFLDFDEPKECFPFRQYEKVLKIKPVAEKHEVTLNLKQLKRASGSKESTEEKSKSVSRANSKASIDSIKSLMSNSSQEQVAASTHSSQSIEKKKISETYMFSELIEVRGLIKNLKCR